MIKNTAYLYHLNLRSETASEAYPLLPSEIQRSHEKHYTLSRYLIRDVLKAHHIPLEDFHYHEKQPRLQSDWSISLSHCDDIFVIALMKTKSLGVDIQTHAVENLPRFNQKYGLNLHNTHDFLTHWTLTEAYCKASQDTLFKALRTPIKDNLKKNQLHFWITDTPYPIALVSDGKIEDVICFSKVFSGQNPGDSIE